MSWDFIQLSKLAHFKNGLNFSKDNFGKGLKVIGVGDFKDYTYPKYNTLTEINPSGVVREEDYLENGDVLFVRSNGNRNLIGRTLLIKDLKEEVSHSGFTIRARFHDPEVFVPFYFHFFRSGLIRAVLSIYGGGTNINNLNQGILNNLVVPKPKLQEQRKIAATLSAYDELIENNNHRITLLENIAEEIYLEWFVRFRFPGSQNLKFEKYIPKDWNVMSLDSLVDITSSKRIFLSDYVEVGVPFYRSKEVIQRFKGAEPSSPLYISEEKFLEIDERFGSPKENDILVTSVGTLGIPCLVRKHDRFYFKDGNLIWLKSRSDINSKFIFCWMKTSNGKNSLLETTIGSSQQAFTISGLKKVKILMPVPEVLSSFFNIIDPINSQIENLNNQNRNLKSTKDNLLQRLISGKLSVEDLDIKFPLSMLDAESVV
jgi:type I restriction enzyme S subunit